MNYLLVAIVFLIFTALAVSGYLPEEKKEEI